MKYIPSYLKIQKKLKLNQYTWLITGVAGFIGSNILSELLMHGQKVIGIDNLSTGRSENLEIIKSNFPKNKWKNFLFIKGDINNFDFSKIKKIDFVLHQAARGSVIRSILDPLSTNKDNVDGFLKIINFSRLRKVKSFTYASSSSVYGDSKILPKKEIHKGNLLSNYALTKSINEMYADVFFRQYKFKSIGLRYFNVFGKFQNPEGEYAAVIPRWIKKAINGKDIHIYGDGKTSRDFTPVINVVYANLSSALIKLKPNNYVFNVGNEGKVSLNYLVKLILKYSNKNPKKIKLIYKNFRKGDIKHSLANINKIKKILNYRPIMSFEESLKKTVEWHLKKNVK